MSETPRSNPLAKTTSAVIAAAMLAAALAACNTVEGVGRDLKSAGKKIEDVASDDDKK
ncbi:MAG: entericidin A/B family lipoprotein [Rhodospirillaceae bacterium]|nr:entericidin A/B family lipoprotein [Rhodospirillaceae bacterium]